MHGVTTMRIVKSVARFMACALLLPYASCGALAARAPKVETQTLVVFPMDYSANPSSTQVAEELTKAIRKALSSVPKYVVIAYSENLPSVERMVKMEQEKSHILSGPFYSDRKAIGNAVAIGQSMSADLVVVGTVDKYNVSEKGIAELGATVELVDSHTGKTIRSVVVTGRSGDPSAAQAYLSKQSGPESEAVSDTVKKIVSGISGEDAQTAPQQTPPTEQPKKKKSNNLWWGVALLGLAIGLLAGNHGGSGGGSSSEPGIPPPPI